MALLVLVPLFFFLCLFLFSYSQQRSFSVYEKIRIAFLNSFLIGSIITVCITELLSYFSLLKIQVLLPVWLFMCLILVFLLIRRRTGNSLKEIISARKNLSRGEKWIFGTISFLVFCSLVIAIIYPINNYDSQTYHMARVGYWEQNNNISHYKTHILRQLELAPFAEWVILHLQLLSGGDRFANSVQLFFFCGCFAAVSLIAKRLGANRVQQSFAALTACFIPMAILESNTTQNDLVASFFILAFVYYTLESYHTSRWPVIVFAGISLGLAWLTKGSGFIFLALFCVWYLFYLFKYLPKSFSTVLQRAGMFLMIPVLAIIINSGHFSRNIFLSGEPLGNEGDGTINESFEVKPLILVAVKNVMSNMPVTRSFKDSVYARSMKLGVDPDDTKYSLTALNYMAEGFSFHEDTAQNFFHVILIFISFGLFFFRRKVYQVSTRPYLFFVLTLAFTAILYSVMLKWQPWGNRLMTPLFMLFAVFIGIEIGRLVKWIRVFVATAIIVYGFTALCYSTRHPVLPISRSIFAKEIDYNSIAFDPELIDMKKYLDTKPHKKFGIYIGKDSWDYVYYKLLRGEGRKKRELKHVFVYENYSMKYIDDFIPDAIISFQGSVQEYKLSGITFRQTHQFGKTVLFERQ